MGVRILSGEAGACLYDSVTDWAFGPLFASEEQAEAFCAWHREHYAEDVRQLTDAELQARYSACLAALAVTCPRCGAATTLEREGKQWVYAGHDAPGGAYCRMSGEEDWSKVGS